ncbi:hypothetical protein F4801DRAFT_559346 [Xylaria longipes]|nr:hypothetical protein F4801DRAFT_559346 [Xylaria longipes]
MTSPSSTVDVFEAERFEGRVIIRRFTDELVGANELERSTKAAQVEVDEEEKIEERKRIRLLYEDPEDGSALPQDFDVAELAREALRRMVNEFNDNAKPSVLQLVGISPRSAKTKATEVLGDAVHDFHELKASVEKLEKNWKENHGPIYNAFKKICGTLDDHKSLLAVFPSQNIYTSVLAGSLSCLVKAAKNHSDIAETLSKSVANISDKVATCSSLIIVIKTRRLRKRLANIYARMFQFYRDAIKWYLQSKLSRIFSSFNENLKKGCTDAMNDLEDCIKELYREASVGSAAMIAMLNSNYSELKAELQRQRRSYEQHDTLAGHRMFVLMEASWMNSKSSNETIAPAKLGRLAVDLTHNIEEVASSGITRAEARTYGDAIKAFIIGDEGSGLSSARGGSWVAEDGVLLRLRTWMLENVEPSTLWISSPSDVVGITSARAAALAVVASAWQAETPLISHFCQRLQPNKVRPGTSIEQVGLIGVVYSLIHQLLQFSEDMEELNVSVESLAALDGRSESWGASLEVLGALLDHTPQQMYCVVDGVNDLEFGNGKEWCRQFLDVLFARQRRVGTIFNILLTTAGQSRVLPSFVQVKDRHLATKRAMELARFGRRIEL